MNEFLTSLRQFLRGFRCWIIVSPWEQAIRVRRGVTITILKPGWHWKLPILDSIYLQNVRYRVVAVGKQTLSPRSGEVLVIASSLGYRIADILPLYQTLHHAEGTLYALVRGAIADYITTHDRAECTLSKIQAATERMLADEFRAYGLSDIEVVITEFSTAKTYRIIGDYSNEYAWGKPLATDAVHTGDSQ